MRRASDGSVVPCERASAVEHVVTMPCRQSLARCFVSDESRLVAAARGEWNSSIRSNSLRTNSCGSSSKSSASLSLKESSGSIICPKSSPSCGLSSE